MARGLLAIGVLGTAAACGGVESDTDAPPAIDARDIDTALDVDAIPARCNPTAPFGTPMPVTELNTTPSSEDCPKLTADERTIYFSSTRTGGMGGWDIWFATRAARDQPFGQAMLLGGAINTASMQRCPAVTADGLALYGDNFANDYNMAVSTRLSTSDPFGAMNAVAALNIGTNDSDPHLLADRTMFHSSDGDIYRATWNGSAFNTPVKVTGTNLGGADTEAAPVVSEDELTMYIQSARTGSAGGSYDIWRTTRATTVAAFGDPVNVTELNSSAIEVPGWISDDDCVIYFMRNVGTAATDYDLFYAVRGM
jgi:hypothetical protein